MRNQIDMSTLLVNPHERATKQWKQVFRPISLQRILGRKTFLFWKISLIWNCLCSVVLKCLRRLLLWEVYKHHRPFKTSGFVSKYSRRERSSRRGSRILKWGGGVNFCNNVLEPINIWGIRKKKKEGGSEKEGWKFTHFTSPGSAPGMC